MDIIFAEASEISSRTNICSCRHSISNFLSLVFVSRRKEASSSPQEYSHDCNLPNGLSQNMLRHSLINSLKIDFKKYYLGNNWSRWSERRSLKQFFSWWFGSQGQRGQSVHNQIDLNLSQFKKFAKKILPRASKLLTKQLLRLQQLRRKLSKQRLHLQSVGTGGIFLWNRKYFFPI